MRSRAVDFAISDERKELITNSFAYGKGRMFERWVDNILAGARDNGFDADDLIQCPPYIIESLIRDENFAERDLIITDRVDSTHIEINALQSSVDDYYNYAIYYNVTTNFKTYISDYDGSTKIITLASADASSDDSDDIIIINIQGDLKIDYATVDTVGNTTNGTRKDWLFARAYTSKTNISNILSELLFESHCELIESVNPDTGLVSFKLVAIDSGSGDTWTNPAYAGGLEQVTAELTPIENIFTKFRLRYFYDYGKGDYLKEIYVDKNSFPSTATILSATEQTLCSDAETNYQVSQLFEYSSMNIYDDATAERMLQKKIEWYTKQRLVVRYITALVGASDFIKYEKGDQVKLNFSKGIPTGLNNSSMFMITEKIITPLIGGGHITWELIEL